MVSFQVIDVEIIMPFIYAIQSIVKQEAANLSAA